MSDASQGYPGWFQLIILCVGFGLIGLGEQRSVNKRSGSKLDVYESQMGTVNPRQSPDAGNSAQSNSTTTDTYRIDEGSTTTDEANMFSMIKKPRVRYDVEVVTRLIVYIGKSLPRSFHLQLLFLAILISSFVGIGVLVVDYMAYVFDFLGLAP